MIDRNIVDYIYGLVEESKENLKLIANSTNSVDGYRYSSRCNEIARKVASIARESYLENSIYDEEITRYYISVCISAADAMKIIKKLEIKEN